MFCLDVVKVNPDIAYTCMLQAYVLSVSYICLQVFYLDVDMFAMVFKGDFASVLYIYRESILYS
jgi:hypothetical protein